MPAPAAMPAMPKMKWSKKSALCFSVEGTIAKRELLLQGLLNSNSHGNGHTDHGVVTSGIVLSHRAYSVSFYWFVVRKRCVLMDLILKITLPYTVLFPHLVAKLVAQNILIIKTVRPA